MESLIYIMDVTAIEGMWPSYGLKVPIRRR